MSARGAYRSLSRVLPTEFRAAYGVEMEEAFLESLALSRRRLGILGTPYAFAKASLDLLALARRLRAKSRPAPRRRSRGLEGFLEISRDLRVTLRRLMRSPGLTLASVATLALGVGATVTMLTFVDAVLLRPLPYPEAERLVALFLHEEKHDHRRAPTSPVNFHAWREESETLELMSAAHPWAPSLSGRDRPDELQGLKASPSLFQMLRATPLLGRTLDERDAEPGSDRVVVLGHGLWRRRFGQDPSIVGQSLVLDGEAHEVVGVMPEGFRFPPFWAASAEMWAPLSFSPEEARRHSRYLRVFARLKHGATVSEARAEMEAIGRRLVDRYPERNAATSVNLEPLLEPVIAEARPALVVSLAAVGLLALLACANVANLQLVRAAGRARELALETALGASRARLLREQLAEGVVLAGASGIVGGLFALWSVSALVGIAPDTLPRLAEIRIDGRTLLFTLAASSAVAGIVGLVTVPRRRGAGAALRDGGSRATPPGATRLRDGLVIWQVATSVVLLVAAGLVARSFLELKGVDPGFRRDHLLTSSLLLAGSPHTEPERQTLLFRQIRESVGALPGVEHVALINHLPIGGDSWGLTYDVEGRRAASEADRPRASQRTVTPGYFHAMDVPLLAGRDFRDEEDGAPSVLVNRTLAEGYGSVEEMVGRRVRIGGGDDWRTVVGVVGDTHQWDLTQEIESEIYFPYDQNPASSYLTATLIVVTASEPEDFQPLIERTVWSVAGEIPVANVRTMERILDGELAPRRFTTLLFVAFASMSSLLAAVGLYGVLSYTVAQQRREIGIRAALGASSRDLRRLVLGKGAALTGIGIFAGLAAAVAGSRFLTNLLFGIGALDPLTFVAVPVLVAIVASVAIDLPARRASRLDPLSALRSE